MIYCHIEPGLLMVNVIPSGNVKQLRILVDSLSLHGRMMSSANTQLPVTVPYISRVMDALNRSSSSTEESYVLGMMRKQVLAILGRSIKPAWPPAGIHDIRAEPVVISSWIAEDVQQMWLDCLVAALYEKETTNGVELACATWKRDGLPSSIKVICPEIGTYGGKASGELITPLLASDLDWKAFLALVRGWPNGLSTDLIDHYAACYHLVPDNKIGQRHSVIFEHACLRDISNETDDTTRSRIIDVIARLTYNCLLPENGDETIKSQRGMRRVYVKKMAPVIRLHYHLDDNTVTFTMYSNGDHDKGL